MEFILDIVSAILPFLRHEIRYRTAGQTQPLAMLGCGFMLKPEIRVDSMDGLAGHYSIVYVLRGTGLYRDEDGREWRLSPGMAFQRFPRRRHSLLITPDGQWAECFLAFDTATQEALSRFGHPNERTPVLHPGLHADVVERVDRLLKRLGDAVDAELPGLLAQAVGLLADFKELDAGHVTADAPERLVEAAKRALGRNLGSRVSIPVLLGDLDAGYESLRKLFQTRTGMSPVAYRLRRRIDAARAMLDDKELSIKEIANALGYPSPYAFSAQFKQLTGVPPTQFRSG